MALCFSSQDMNRLSEGIPFDWAQKSKSYRKVLFSKFYFNLGKFRVTWTVWKTDVKVFILLRSFWWWFRKPFVLMRFAFCRSILPVSGMGGGEQGLASEQRCWSSKPGRKSRWFLISFLKFL